MSESEEEEDDESEAVRRRKDQFLQDPFKLLIEIEMNSNLIDT